MKKKIIIVLIILLSSAKIFTQPALPEKSGSEKITYYGTPKGGTIRYDLYIADTVVNYSGEKANAISVNGQIPAPTLYFTEGDTAEIYVHNKMDVETSIHWHGIILPNEQDGVPYLTTEPIWAHSTHFYKFPIVQSGTYWYHAHTQLQEQIGLYGALILHKKKEDTIPEYALVLSDWTNENPNNEVLRSLKMANDWYAIKKGSTQNYGEALLKGHLGAKITQEWLRMFPMDVSDVYYDALLANGKVQQTLPKLKAGDKIKLRIINGASSSYFWLQFAGGKLSVVASDGEDVVPVEVDRMIVGVAETYDVIVTIPDNKNYEFRATSEDRTKSASLWLGDGVKVSAPTLPTLKYFEGMKMMNNMMNFDGTMKDMGMQMRNQEMDMNSVMYPEISGYEDEDHLQHNMDSTQMNMNDSSGGEIVTLNYGMLRSTKKTTLPNVPTKTYHFKLTGNMNRYQWSINNTTLGDTSKILIHKGENVRVVLTNASMMRHPMHLHGHYFRVLNEYGEYAPLKNVLDIMPMETDTIEFTAPFDLYGDWFFHCHILYHMMSGMGRVFSYADSPPNPQIDPIKDAYGKFTSDENMLHFSTFIAGQSNGVFPRAMVMNRNYIFDVIGAVNYVGDLEGEVRYGRLFGDLQYLRLYVGGDVRKVYRQHGHGAAETTGSEENRLVATTGINYILPMFILADLRIDHTGKVRFQVTRNDFALTSRLRLDGYWNTDNEYEIGLRYIVVKRFSVSTSYDSHFRFGAGITFTY